MLESGRITLLLFALLTRFIQYLYIQHDVSPFVENMQGMVTVQHVLKKIGKLHIAWPFNYL